jgi:hypothetical protein
LVQIDLDAAVALPADRRGLSLNAACPYAVFEIAAPNGQTVEEQLNALMLGTRGYPISRFHLATEKNMNLMVNTERVRSSGIRRNHFLIFFCCLPEDLLHPIGLER